MLAPSQGAAESSVKPPKLAPNAWCARVIPGVAAKGPIVMGFESTRRTVPDCFDSAGYWLDNFLETIISEAAGEVAFVKIQAAFYEALGL